jgi:parallel beta-helix repeat protein
VAGDTLYLRGGTYVQSIRSNDQTIPVGTAWANAPQIKAYPGEIPIIQPSGGSEVMNLASFVGGNDLIQYLIIDGLVFDGINTTNGDVVSLNGTKYVRMQNADIKNSGPYNHPFAPINYTISVQQGPAEFNELLRSNVHHARGSHGLYIRGANNFFDGLNVYDNAFCGMQLYATAGGVNNNTVKNSKFYGNGGFINELGVPQECAGLYIGSGNGNIAYNNVVYNNREVGIEITTGTNSQVYHNTVVGNVYGGFVIFNSSGDVIKNNIASENGSAYGNIYDTAGATFAKNLCSSEGTGCDSTLVGDPSFVSATAGDFHLRVGSKAIDAGVDLGDPYRVDAENRARGIPPDVGAYEFVPAEPPPQPPPPGLQVELKGNGTSADTSGKGHDAALINGTLANGTPILAGYTSFVFDGVNDHMTIPENIAFRPTDKLCISVWNDSTGSNYAYFWDVGGSYGFWHDPNGGVHGYIVTSTGLIGAQSGGGVDVRTGPHHLVFTRDAAGALRLYFDKSQVGFTASEGTISYTGTPTIYIGRNGLGAQEFYTGRMGHVRFYNDECTPQAVAQLYAEDVSVANTAMTHMQLARAHAAQTEANLVGVPDSDQALVVTDVVDLLFTITRTGAQTVLHYPLECAVDGGTFTGVTNAFDGLGVKITTNSVLNMGDSTVVPLPANLPLGGLTPVAGRVVADTIDTNVKTTLNTGEATQWRYTLAFDGSLAGKTAQCRPGNVDTYMNVKTLSLLAPPSARAVEGGQWRGVTLQ